MSGGTGDGHGPGPAEDGHGAGPGGDAASGPGPGEGAGFDRVRRRTPAAQPGEAPGRSEADARPVDRRGKRALYSDVTAPPTFGSVALTCSRCQARSVVSWARAVRLAFPSLFVPVPGDGMRTWMRCPACRKRTWLMVSLRG